MSLRSRRLQCTDQFAEHLKGPSFLHRLSDGGQLAAVVWTPDTSTIIDGMLQITGAKAVTLSRASSLLAGRTPCKQLPKSASSTEVAGGCLLVSARLDMNPGQSRLQHISDRLLLGLSRLDSYGRWCISDRFSICELSWSSLEVSLTALRFCHQGWA